LDLEAYGPQITKLGFSLKVGPTSQFLQFFHPKSTKIDENLYNDPLWFIGANSEGFVLLSLVGDLLFPISLVFLEKQDRRAIK
jgi:hypothetical protein